MNTEKFTLLFSDSTDHVPEHDREVLVRLPSGPFQFAYYNKRLKCWMSVRCENGIWNLEGTEWSELPK